MQGYYKILVVITPIKIKQTKKHWVVSVMSFNTLKRALTDVMWCVSMFYSVNTKITNFSISGTSTSKIIYFSFCWTLPPSFSWRLMELFLGAPFQDRTTFFLLHWYYFLNAFLKKRMAPSTLLEVRSEVLNAKKNHLYQGYCYWVVRN